MRKKVVFLPYDFDTAIGINNEGDLVFSYNLEDTDHTESGADIFNGQQSVLWINLRNAFAKELKAMYQSLRSSGAISFERIEEMFEAHQGKWPEAIFNEDSFFKYLQPLIDNGNASYLPMLQGSKAEQRRWWLYNRFRYIDSKYNAGDALTDYIQIRGYAKSNVVITPYADVYASVKYGSYLVQTRATRNQQYTMTCPVDELNDTEIYIYSASQLASVGDLSGFKVGFADFSMATKLQSLKLGDSSSSYSNGNLKELHLGNNTLLRTIDIRNCPALVSPIDISGCSNIEHVYFEGTNITGLTIPNGGILKTLHLPDSITNLTIRNQTAITDFSIPTGANITTLRLENVSASVDSKALLMNLAAASRLRLIGFSWDVGTYEAAAALFDKFDTMRGLDENGGNVDNAQVSGTLHVTALTGVQLAALRERYADVTVTYDHITTTLTYYNWEGDTVLYTETIQDGGDGTYTGTPSHASDARYTYTFAGWALSSRATSANADALKNVNENRNVYAAYTLVGQTYTVYFYNGSTEITSARKTGVPYGGSVTYSGATPIHPTNPDTMVFTGWSPAPTNITGNTTCCAQYQDTSPALLKYLKRTITEWESDTATVVGQYAFYNMTTLTSVKSSATTIGQYAFSGCSNLDTVDLTGAGQVSIAANAFASCNKMTAFIIRSTAGVATASSNSLPAAPFLALDGAIYVPASLLSTYKSTSPWSTYASRIFPIDDYPITNFDTVSDSWAEIIAASANGTYASKYNIHDTKTLTYGSTSVVMELVAKDTDVKANSEETAHMTWMVKNFKTTHRMNKSRTTAGGWPSIEMLTWLEGSDVFGAFPSELKSAIVSVQKTYYDNDDSSTKTTTNTIWIPSSREVCLTGSYLKETSGVQYSSVFSDSASRIKYDSSGSANTWWLRSAYSGTAFVSVNSSGGGTSSIATSANGVVFGFCI